MRSYWPALLRPRKFQRLSVVRSPADAVLLLRVAAIATCVPVLMRLRLDQLRAVLEPRHARGDGDVARVLALVNLALDGLRPLLKPTCLTRGVTRYYFMRRAGLQLSLAFGVNLNAEGHCWLVRDGEPFLEMRDPRPLFRELYRISPRD